MDFELTELQTRLRDAAAEYVKSEVAPIAAELDKTKDREKLLKILKGLAGRGFMGITIDPAYGGTGADTISFSLVMTELGRGCASTSVTTSVTNMVAEVIERIGKEDQKAKYIPRLCSGEYAAGGFALTEPIAGSDPAAMRMSATPDGDHWVLNGTKIFISSAEFAGVFVVWAVTDREARKGKGISAFLVESSAPGLRVGKHEKKLGQLASPTNEVIFDNCLVPRENMLGELNDGFRIAASELAGGRIGIGSMAVGIGMGALDYVTEHFKKNGQPDPATQSAIADNYARLAGARLLLFKAASLKDRKKYYAKEASMAKVYATEAADAACHDAVRLLGDFGCVEDCPVERFYRDVRVTRIYEGTSEIQRLIIARELLR
ncbi:MAG: acyl-CoA dehydrogenase family protein [Desulfobacteraceae bacterium]|nr:acyl-CoA dehydrogenase family protein [Desulfobacteraceae bacterium]